MNFSVNEKISTVTYSLDGEDNVTIAGNTTLTGLPIGAHNLTVYASDAAGNVGASQTVNFTIINMTPTPIQASEPFLTMPVAAILLVALTGSGLGIMALKKRKR